MVERLRHEKRIDGLVASGQLRGRAPDPGNGLVFDEGSLLCEGGAWDPVAGIDISEAVLLTQEMGTSRVERESILSHHDRCGEG